MIHVLPLQNLKKENVAEKLKRAYLALTKDLINRCIVLNGAEYSVKDG